MHLRLLLAQHFLFCAATRSWQCGADHRSSHSERLNHGISDLLFAWLHHWQLSVAANISMQTKFRYDSTGEYARILYAK